MIPHTIVLQPGLVVHSIYNGYWFWGRPSFADLWRDLRAAMSESRPDWDLSTPGLREAWDAKDYTKFHGWDRRAAGGATSVSVPALDPRSPARATSSCSRAVRDRSLRRVICCSSAAGAVARPRRGRSAQRPDDRRSAPAADAARIDGDHGGGHRRSGRRQQCRLRRAVTGPGRVRSAPRWPPTPAGRNTRRRRWTRRRSLTPRSATRCAGSASSEPRESRRTSACTGRQRSGRAERAGERGERCGRRRCRAAGESGRGAGGRGRRWQGSGRARRRDARSRRCRRLSRYRLFPKRLEDAAGDGFDLFFDNVGGEPAHARPVGA